MKINRNPPFYLSGPSLIKVEGIIGNLIFYKQRWGISQSKEWDTIENFEKLHKGYKYYTPNKDTWEIS